jgi:hypothetical protein
MTQTKPPKDLKLQVRFVPADTLKPYYRNTKQHSPEQLKKMSKLLDRFYFDQPIVVTPDFVIIKGHGRYLASLLTGKKRLVPIVVRSDLTPAQVKAARISDNKLFELGEAIPELIQSEMVDFVTSGGEGAHDVFDFISPGLASTTATEAEPAAPKAAEPTPVATKAKTLDDFPDFVPEGTPVPAPKAVKDKTPAVKTTSSVGNELRCPNCNMIHEA